MRADVLQLYVKRRKREADMSDRITKIAIFVLLICMSAVLASAFSCENVAFASDEKIDAIVSVRLDGEGKVWYLTVGSDTAEIGKGDFFDGEKVYYSLKNAFANTLFDKGVITSDQKAAYIENASSWDVNAYFDVQFVFPAMSEITSNAEEMTYTNDDAKGVDFSVESTPSVVGFWSSRLDYNKAGESGVKHKYSSASFYSITLGNGVGAGEYNVKYVAAEKFEFDGKEFVVERASANSARFTIKKATLSAPTVNTIEVEYGTSVSTIASMISGAIEDEAFLSAGSGTFVSSGSQSDAIFDGVLDKGAVIPQPRDAEYTVKYDFESASGNYLPVQDIEVKIVVKPRKITVRISDVYTLVGEDLISIENIGYTVDGTLVGGDTQDDLGVRLVCNADKDAPGVYPITATFENHKYEAESKSASSDFVQYGRYMVFTRRVSATAPDGTIFEVYYDKGFVEIKTVVVTALDAVSTLEGKKIVCAYRIELADNFGNVIVPEGEYYVSWKGAMNDAKYVCIGEGKNVQDISAYSGGAALTGDNCEIFFYVDDIADRGQDDWIDIVLISLAVLFAACVVMMILCRNKATMIGSVLHDTSVYVRENGTLNADCAQTVQNEEQKEDCKKEKNAPAAPAKKQRHGKANKQRKAARNGCGGEEK